MKRWRSFIRRGKNVIVDGFEMSVNKGETERRPMPLGPLRPERPLERSWPTPTPGIPIPKRSEENRMLKQILDKLIDIEKRLGRIEKLLGRKQIT